MTEGRLENTLGIKAKQNKCAAACSAILILNRE
jgi:hypothetical protein